MLKQLGWKRVLCSKYESLSAHCNIEGHSESSPPYCSPKTFARELLLPLDGETPEEPSRACALESSFVVASSDDLLSDGVGGLLPDVDERMLSWRPVLTGPNMAFGRRSCGLPCCIRDAIILDRSSSSPSSPELAARRLKEIGTTFSPASGCDGWDGEIGVRFPPPDCKVG